MIKTRLYKLVRHNIKTADLIEFASDSIIGSIIRGRTGQGVNHTSSAIWQNDIDGIDAKRSGIPSLYIGEAITHGYQRTYLSHCIEKFDGKVYHSALKAEHDGYRLEIAKELQRLEGRPYDYKSLIRNLWRRVPLCGEKPYCSEAVQIALIRTGLLDKSFSPTGKSKHSGCGLWPGEFGKTGLYEKPIRIL